MNQKTHNYLFSFITIIVCCYSAISQDIHLSQFNENPSLVNPALTGANHTIRASVNYRDQWRSVTNAYKTIGASVEAKLKPSNWEQVDEHRQMIFKQKAFSRLAAGLSFYNDKAGDGNMGLSQANLSIASFVPVSDKSVLSVGLQASIAQRKVDYTKLIFPNQYNGSGYDASVFSGETNLNQNFTYADFAAGILWSLNTNDRAIGSNDALKANVGASIYHINQPRLKYTSNNKERLGMRSVIHGSCVVGIPNSYMAFAPSFLVQVQGRSNEIVVGSLIKFYINDNSKYTGLIQRSCFSLGVHYRNQDAVILTSLIEWKKYAIGVSYDINTSGLTKVSYLQGGPEITLRFNSITPYLYQKKEGEKVE